MKKIALCIASFLSVLASPLFAATPGYYAGAGIGWSNLDTPNSYTPTFYSVLKSHQKKGGAGGKLFAGYNFNQYLGLEAGYNRYAQSQYSNTAILNSNSTAISNAKYSLYAFDLLAKGYLPLGDTGLNAYALGGLAYVSSTTDYNAKIPSQGIIANGSATTKKIRPMYGIGVSYTMPQSPLTTSVELSRIQGQGNLKTNPKAIPNANMASINLAYNFD